MFIGVVFIVIIIIIIPNSATDGAYLGIADVRKGVSCHCCGCKNESVFVQATQSPQLFRDAVCCKRIKFSGLELPHNPQFTPEFRPFKCVVDTDLPPHKNVVNCSRCGLNKIVPTSCAAMSTTSLSKTVHWNKRIPTAYQTTKGGWSTKVIVVYSWLVFLFAIYIACVSDGTKGTRRLAV